MVSVCIKSIIARRALDKVANGHERVPVYGFRELLVKNNSVGEFECVCVWRDERVPGRLILGNE